MKTKIVFNDSSKDILSYPIEEAEIDESTGTTIWDEKTQWYKKTGTTLEWTIKAGETLELPAYAADYLMNVYGFLREVKDGAVVEEVQKEEESKHLLEESFKCKYCGKAFDKKKAFVMHVASAHIDEVVA